MAWWRKPLTIGYRRGRGLLRHHLRGRRVHLAILVTCLCLVVLPFMVPLDHLAAEQVGFRWRLYCYLNDHWGWHSPSGALIRSFSHCARGDLIRAFDYSPHGPLLFLYLALQIPYRLWAIARVPKSLPRRTRRLQTLYTLLILILILCDWLGMVGRHVW
jgi:hypothetical protein